MESLYLPGVSPLLQISLPTRTRSRQHFLGSTINLHSTHFSDFSQATKETMGVYFKTSTEERGVVHSYEATA